MGGVETGQLYFCLVMGLFPSAWAIYCMKKGRFSGGAQQGSGRFEITKKEEPKLFWFLVMLMLGLGVFFMISPLLVKMGLISKSFFEGV